MATRNIIDEAIKILNSQDWYWRMSDYDFDSNYEAAKAGMRRFVATVNSIADVTIKNALRGLWSLK